ncbi:MAG: hypothetical protein IPI50_12855 [Saprospiraceae bacterium]|nr:hypothetical protein [Saprospiraceae bacterium]
MDSNSWKLTLTDNLYFSNQPHLDTIINRAKELEAYKFKPDSTKLQEHLTQFNDLFNKKSKNYKCSLHLNHLLFILVALGGFLGNLIHIASSFTTFVGLRKFKRSWLMWYYVKPFIASALAVAVYIIYRGGFTNIRYDGADINPYGIVSLAILSGLFTNTITDKLEKILDVIFPEVKQDKDSAEKDPKLISAITPTVIEKGKKVSFTVTIEDGDQYDELFVFVNNQRIESEPKKGSKLTFNYTHPREDSTNDLKVDVKDGEKEDSITIQTFHIKVINNR